MAIKYVSNLKYSSRNTRTPKYYFSQLNDLERKTTGEEHSDKYSGDREVVVDEFQIEYKGGTKKQ